jgi:hypothetical protein
MRALAGPAMLLVMVGGFLIHRYLSKEEAPPREFTELEFAGADPERAGSCYSLSTVLIANRTTGGAARTWTKPRDGAWSLMLDAVTQGYGGPVRVFQKFTFEKAGGQVRLVDVEAAKGMKTGIKENVDELLEMPNALHSTPVDRCQSPGAAGYLFVPRR